MGQEFDVLGTMRAIRKDKLLSASAKALLVFAALRANKHDGKVRASLEMLAEDAGLSRRTVERALAEDQHEALKYFSRVERNRRRVDLWFNLDPSTTQCRTREPRQEPATEASATPCPPSATPCRTECDTVSHHLPLSTTTSTTTEVPSLGIFTRPSDVEPVEDVWALVEKLHQEEKARSEKEPAKPANPATPVASLPISKITKPSETTEPDIWDLAEAELAKKSGGEEVPADGRGRKDG